MNEHVENATYSCPVCNSSYPATKKFCRLDGAELIEVLVEPPAVVPGGLIPEIPPEAGGATEILPVVQFSETANPLEGFQSANGPVLAVTAAPVCVPTPQPAQPYLAITAPPKPKATVVEEKPAAPSIQLAPGVMNPGPQGALLRPLLVGAGVGVLLLAFLGGGVYLMKQRREQPVPPPVVEVAKSPAQLEGEINRALREAGLNEVFSAVDDRFGVLLKGAVPSEALKAKAIEATRSFPQIVLVRDMIFVVGE